MASLVTDFREPVRWLLGDHDDSYRVYEDGALDRGIRTVVKSGRLNVDGVIYRLTSDNLTITPSVPDGDAYLLLSAKVALGFVAAMPSRKSVRTRAWSQSVGGQEELVTHLEQLIYEVEGGAGSAGFQSYQGFIEGYGGMGSRAWNWMTRLNFGGPVASVSVGDGVINSDSEVKDMQQNVTFQYIDPLDAGTYLIGAAVWDRKVEVTRVLVNCRAPAGGNVVLSMEVNGAEVYTVVILDGESSVQETLNVRVNVDEVVRWKCKSLTVEGLENSASEVGVTCAVRYFDGN